MTAHKLYLAAMVVALVGCQDRDLLHAGLEPSGRDASQLNPLADAGSLPLQADANMTDSESTIDAGGASDSGHATDRGLNSDADVTPRVDASFPDAEPVTPDATTGVDASFPDAEPNDASDEVPSRCGDGVCQPTPECYRETFCQPDCCPNGSCVC